MDTLNLVIGTPEWHAHRLQHFNASDAPAMLSCSPYRTRSELLHALHTGLSAEVDAGTQRRFDDGHRFEALARPLAEEIIGDDLAPVVGTVGELSASFDGLTLMGDTAWEHKSLNDELRGCMKDQGNGWSLPKHYQVQMEQQLIVSGAERVLFMASKWDGDTLVEERHCWYATDPKLRAEILAGWKQFAVDLAAYVKPAAAPLPAVPQPMQALPAVVVTVTGEITVADNFGAFEVAFRDFLDHRLIRKPKTDEDFGNLEVQIKAMKGAEAALDAGEANMIAQLSAVDTARKTKQMLMQLVRENRLMSEKLLTAEKESRRGEIVAGGVSALRDHVAGLTKRIGKPYMPAITADFAGSIKGKRNLAAMEDAVASELARAKIAANEIADRIQANMAAIDAAGQPGLFADTATLVLKAPEDCAAAISNRLAAEATRLEAERAKIRQEEAAKLAREQEARDAAAAAEAAKPAPTPTPPPAAAPAPVPAPQVVQMHRPAAPVASTATIRLGQINDRLLKMTVTVENLRALGFEPVGKERAAVLYREVDLPLMYAAMVSHLESLQAARAA